MRVHTGSGVWVVPPQRALWMPPRIEHWIHCRSRVAMRTIYLDPCAVPGLGRKAVVLTASPLLRELVLRLVEGGPGDRAALLAVLVGELTELPVAPLSLPEPGDPRLQRACAAMRERPGDATSLAQLARASGASARTLMRLFPAETGLTFRAWQRQLRLLVALEELAEGRQVTAVALDLGYATPSAFIAAFRHALGSTPARYFRQA